MKHLVSAMAVIALVVVTWWAFGSTSSFEPVAAGVRVGGGDVYNPVTAGDPLPDGFRQVLPRDGIPPIYDPRFTSADAVGWPDETQVIGVGSDDEAKAYPVSFLNRHEMVNDFIAGEPILVTW